MKRFVLFLFGIFICAIAYAATETINWYVGDTTHATTTCQTGGDIILPTAPTKYGYTFQGWLDYIPIEYLESTGTQYIDTGVIIKGTNTDINAEMSVVSTSSQAGNVPFFFGAGNPWVASFAINHSGYQQYTLYAQSFSGSNCVLNEKHLYRFILGPNNAKFYVDDTLYGNHTNLASVDGDDNIYLFARNADGKVGYFSYMKLYRFSISMGNILVRDFIPVLDKDGVPCLFDKVENKFYYNAGTGQFIAGPVVNE